MCILGQREENVKGAPRRARRRGSDAAGPRRARKLAKGQLGPVEDEAPKAARARVSSLLACSRFKSPEGEIPVQLNPVGIGPSTERRVLPRTPHLTLTPAERNRCKAMLVKALGCRSTFVALRKHERLAVGAKEQRLIIAMPCGTRMCEDCDKKRREYEAARVEGHWSLFWTLGIPSRGIPIGTAWRKMGGWVRALFRELRRELACKGSTNVQVSDAERQRIKTLNDAREAGRRALGVMQYAWCLEPHESGYPHLHFVTNAEYIGFEYIKRLWSSIIKARVEWARYEPVTDQDGVCRYLSKYISKTSFPPDLVALMYRRRQWASTVPKKPEPEKEWRIERKKEGSSLEYEVFDPDAYGRVFGWKVEMGKESEYALFSRVLTEEEFQEKLESESSGQEYLAPWWWRTQEMRDRDREDRSSVGTKKCERSEKKQENILSSSQSYLDSRSKTGSWSTAGK